jgi:hypothetical protein
MPDITKQKPDKYVLLVWVLGNWMIEAHAPEGEYDRIRTAIIKIKAYHPRRRWMLIDTDKETLG